MVSTIDIAWAAGLFEGEGCIAASRHGDRPALWTLGLQSTDEDVVLRFNSIFPGRFAGPWPPKVAGNKPFWTWKVGAKQDVLSYAMTMFALLGDRRREKAAECIRNIVARGNRYPDRKAA